MGDLPLTYPDLLCLDDLDPYASETTSDLQNLAQDVHHILLEELGSNPDDPSRGVGVLSYLGADEKLFGTLPGTIDTQLSEDDRINSSTTTAQKRADGSWDISIVIKVDESVLPLAFNLSTAKGLVAA